MEKEQHTSKYLYQAQWSGAIIGSAQQSIASILDPSLSLPQLMNSLFKAAITIGAILAVVRLIYAGIVYMSKDSWGSKQNATTMMNQAVVGLLLLLGIYVILYQINPQMLELQFLNGSASAPTNQAQPFTGSLTE